MDLVKVHTLRAGEPRVGGMSTIPELISGPHPAPSWPLAGVQSLSFILTPSLVTTKPRPVSGWPVGR